jgi:hypothetical protein
MFGILAGCSGGSTDPVIPLEAPDPPSAESASVSHGLWGYFTGYADPAEGIFEISPLRAVDLHLNLVSVLNGTAGVTAQVLWGESNPDTGLLTVRITLKHPYVSVPKYAGFDVRGILITGASQQIGIGLWTAGDSHPRLLNADGFTRWWNPNEFMNTGMFGYTNGVLGSPTPQFFDAQLNGFKIFADAFTSEYDDNPLYVAVPQLDSDLGRSVFNSPSQTKRYTIQFPPGASYFNYAVDASWANPAANPPIVPDDFPPNANCPEAWWVRADVAENTLKYYPGNGSHDGVLALNISVYDWQGRMSGAIAPEVALVKVHSSDLFNGAEGSASLINDDGTTAVYLANLTSLCQPDHVGTYKIGIEIISANGAYKQSWHSAPQASLAAYQIISVDVAEGSVEPEFLKVFGIHAFVLRKSDGSGAPISDSEIEDHIDYANAVWNEYKLGFELVERTYINSSTYYNLDPNQSDQMQSIYADKTGLLNVYYVNSILGMGGAYAMIDCAFEDQWAKYSYVVYDANDNVGWDEVLSHELGHYIGMLDDMYWLDYGYTCYDLAMAWCGYYPTDIYCNSPDASGHNLMYWISYYPGAPPSSYYISSQDINMNTGSIDSQAENAVYFHTHFPSHFLDMQ